MRGRRIVGITIAASLTLGAACGSGSGEASPTTRATPPNAADGSAGGAATTTSAALTGPGGLSLGSGKPVTLAFGGDIHYAPPLDDELAANPTTMLDGVKPLLSAADLSIVNLETSIGTSGDKQDKQFTFQAPASGFGPLIAAGVDVIGMANNHALDFGQAGLTQTLAAIADQHAPVIGVGANESEAYRPFTATVHGQRIAVIAATQILNDHLIATWTATATNPGVASAKRVDRLLQAVREARAKADTVIVFLHWGTEKINCPNASQLALAPQLVDAGADLVIGTHAHRVQGGGYLGHAYVEYGLGNLMFKVGSPEAREAGILTVTVTGRRVDDAVWHPVTIGAKYLPTIDDPTDAAAPLKRWEGFRACAKLADAPS